MSVCYVALLAVWGSAGAKRLALLKGQRIPLRFAGDVRVVHILAFVLLLVVLLVILFRILIQ